MNNRTCAPLGLAAAGAAVLGLLPSTALAAPSVTLTMGAHALRPQGAEGAAFWIFGALTVICAVLTITRRNPVVAAVSLVGTLLSSAGIFLLMQASFMAIIQVLVYAGAIMVLFVLVVMSVEHPEHEEFGVLRGTMAKLVGVVAVVWLLLRMSLVMMDLPDGLRRPAELTDATWGQVSSLSRLLFSDYLFPFEAISLLLLTAIVGAVVVTRRRGASGEGEPAADLPRSGSVLTAAPPQRGEPAGAPRRAS